MENTRDIELLLPAGDYETFVSAVENGADAVYIGGKLFSARKNAKNFTEEEIINAVNYAHLRGVRVYVTLNTLIHDKELKDAFEFIKFCYNASVDALIIQDLSIVKIIKEYFPDFEMHASTQMTVSSLAGVQMMKNLGFSRVVLAREMSKDEIAYICKNTDVEIEIFVHGALCVCYSGQCLLSSIIGGRSGNRGECAQPCRLPYQLYDYTDKLINNKPKYLLSLKDYKLLDNLDDIKNIGVKSLKVEGRMKNKEYVSIVSDVYNKKLDGECLTDFDYFKLENIFSRSGFTTSYYENKIGLNMINADSNNDAVYRSVTDDVLKHGTQLSMQKAKKRVLDISVDISKSVRVFAKNGEITVEFCADFVPEIANNAPITEEKVINQLKKLGDTLFAPGNFEVKIDGNYFISASNLNNLRRECVKRIEEGILAQYKRHSNAVYVEPTKNKKITTDIKWNAEVTTFNQAKHILENHTFNNVFVPYNVINEHKEYFSKFNNVVCVLFQIDNFEKYNFEGINKVSVSNIGQLNGLSGKEIFSQPSLNVFNSVSADVYCDFGVKNVSLSYELNLEQLRNISSKANLELTLYGKLPLMVTKSCLHKAFVGNCKCNETQFLKIKDRKNKTFFVKTNPLNCTNTIYNGDPLYMADKMQDLKSVGISNFRMLFTNENNNEIDLIIDMYKNNKKADFSFTRGHFYRGV